MEYPQDFFKSILDSVVGTGWNWERKRERERERELFYLVESMPA
jgi:hypothetical protein